MFLMSPLTEFSAKIPCSCRYYFQTITKYRETTAFAMDGSMNDAVQDSHLAH